MWLIIGRDGQVGKALYDHLRVLDIAGGVRGTSRRGGEFPQFNLTDDPKVLPSADVVFLVASKTKFRDCELDSDAWSVNVDSPIRIAEHFAFNPSTFIAYISSEAAEWSGRTAYGDQKRFAEIGLLSVVGYHRLAVVRPKKLTPERIADLCILLEKVGRLRLYGVHRFL